MAVSHASVADVVAITVPASWFARIDFSATHSVRTNEDQRCPSWSDVSFRRAHVLGTGKLSIYEKVLHGYIPKNDVAGVSSGTFVAEACL